MVAQLDSAFFHHGKTQTLRRLASYALYEGRPLTTRGRWINPLLFLLFRAQARIPAESRVKAPIFIVGTGRSGTTILGKTLAMHPEVGFLNEPKALWHYVCQHDDLLGNYSDRPGRYQLGSADVDADVQRKGRRLYGCYTAVTLSNRVVDKYPEMVFRADFVHSIFPDAQFLFLTRNGWDTCGSIADWTLKKGSAVGTQVQDWWGLNGRKWHLLCEQVVARDPVLGPHADTILSYSDQQHRAAVEWIVSMKRGMAIADRDEVLQVKYEDYVCSAESRNRVLAFCGLEHNSTFDHYCNSVLQTRKPRPAFELPREIASEFAGIMGRLGYE